MRVLRGRSGQLKKSYEGRSSTSMLLELQIYKDIIKCKVARRGGPRSPSRTTDANLEYVVVENALVLIDPKIEAAPSLSDPCSILGNESDSRLAFALFSEIC